jgi:uncharacterized protein YjiS (DUF1127 family)
VKFASTRLISADIKPLVSFHEKLTGQTAMFVETLHLWRQRYRDRRELARWTERDLHDIGVSRSDIAHELEKPFWRA